jgi:hypothetical protein
MTTQLSLALHGRGADTINTVFGSNLDVLRLIGETMVRKGPYRMAELLDHDTAPLGRFEDGVTGWHCTETARYITLASVPVRDRA